MVFLSLIEYATVGFFETKRQGKPTVSLTPTENKAADRNGKFIDSAEYDHLKFPEQMRDSSWIDKLSRLAFPTVFIFFNLIYASVFLFIIDSK